MYGCDKNSKNKQININIMTLLVVCLYICVCVFNCVIMFPQYKYKYVVHKIQVCLELGYNN